MVTPLKSFSARWLAEEPLDPPTWLVEGLLPTCSTNIFAAAPKSGKSWLCLQLAHAVATGSPFLGLKTTKHEVLYLSLEDTKSRLQSRLWAITEESSDNLHLAESAASLDTGLLEQLTLELAAHPDIKLILVDTFQLIRNATADYSYVSDYFDLRQLKRFADDNGLALILVHHLRKAQNPTDEFMNILGTTALSGACDSMFVLRRESRSSSKATLSVTGRDVEAAELVLRRENNHWLFVERKDAEEVFEQSIPDDVKATVAFMHSRGESWTGNASDLARAIGHEDLRTCVLSMHLNRFRDYLREHSVLYRPLKRTATTRPLLLEIVPQTDTTEPSNPDAADANDAVLGAAE